MPLTYAIAIKYKVSAKPKYQSGELSLLSGNILLVFPVYCYRHILKTYNDERRRNNITHDPNFEGQ